MGQGKGLVQSVVTVPYAPEFQDLHDNAALLSEVAAMIQGACRFMNGAPAGPAGG